VTIAHESDRALVWQGDCIELMRSLPDGCIDAVVTDPPYGLEFMGKSWDGADGFRRSLNPNDVKRANVFGRTSRTSPEYRAGVVFEEWTESWAREALRLLKPGGHLLAFGGTRTWHRLASGVEDAGFEIRDSIAWMYGQGFPKSKALLKPAFEPIVFARKPGPLQELNLDACRIGFVSDADMNQTRVPTPIQHNDARGVYMSGTGVGRTGEIFSPNAAGRWPANVILDESQAAALDEQVGPLHTQKPTAPSTMKSSHWGGGQSSTRQNHRDDGDNNGASRFFYVAKAGRKERPKVEGSSAHPTVKPLALMRWLVRLVTPADGLVLDPFAGSGTTVEACLGEGFRCMAMERETEYIPLILHRIERATITT
jgi:DNA modification methylase